MPSYNIIEKEGDFSFHMIYYLCFHALSAISYQSKVMLIEAAVVLNLCKITELRKIEIKIILEILYDLKEF